VDVAVLNFCFLLETDLPETHNVNRRGKFNPSGWLYRVITVIFISFKENLFLGLLNNNLPILLSISLFLSTFDCVVFTCWADDPSENVQFLCYTIVEQIQKYSAAQHHLVE